MSRAAIHDNSDAVSLFPFLAVLLCTMGALVVVLVVMARISRDQGLQHAATLTPAESPPLADDGNRRKLDEVAVYVEQLQQVRAQADKQLRDDQRRLSHLEERMRGQQQQLETLQLVAAELEAMEGERYDDREQAEREVARLQQLIEESRLVIEELREELRTKSKSYAIVPYEGRNGTHRRPLYIECRRDEVLLQPEGIRLTPEDFQRPIGPGNPLAAALRAAREYILREESTGADAADAEPYPLILVRPDGVLAYYRVRDAIESWDSEFGYELVDGDWELKFPPASPQIAVLEHQAVELARGRMKALALAAPRAYSAYGAVGNSFDFDDDSGDQGSFGRPGADRTFGGFESGGFDDGAESEFFVAGGHGGEAGDAGNGESAENLHSADGTDQRSPPRGGGPGAGSAGALSGTKPTGETPDGAPQTAAGSDDSIAAGDHVAAGQSAANGSAATVVTAADDAGTSSRTPGKPNNNAATTTSGSAPAMTASAPAPAEDDAQASRSIQMSSIDDRPVSSQQSAAVATVRGKNWAIRDQSPGSVPIRRTIQVVVRRDQLAILPERTAAADSPAAASTGQEFPLVGPTDRALDEFVAAVQRQIKDWGLAGRGLYWRPVLELNVGPDGQQRADDLVRLLQHSGIELRANIAENTQENRPHATR